MALNPPVSQLGVPLRVEGEFFLLERKEIEIEVKIPNMGKYGAKGILYVTTARLVFVSKNFLKDNFKSFDIPVAYIYNEKFEQPVFGSNYLQGDVKPLNGLLPGDCHFKLWFTAGGCSVFLKVLVGILKQVRERRAQGQIGPDPRWVDSISQQRGSAYMDPNDPSVIYVQQPNNRFQDNQNFIGNNIYQAKGNQVSPVENNHQGQQNPYPQFQQPPQYNQPQSQPQSSFPGQGVQIGGSNQGTLPNQVNSQYQQQQPQYSNPPSQYPQQQQQQPLQQQSYQPNQPNVGYYYGFWGPQINSNSQGNQHL